MKIAAVSELKASLSEILSTVKAGEEVLVTERGKSVAKVIPLKREETEIPGHLLNLERAGLIHIGTTKLTKKFWDMPRCKDKKGFALTALTKEREEGR